MEVKNNPNVSFYRRVFGSMMGGQEEEEDSGSLDSDSDLILDGVNVKTGATVKAKR